MQSNTLQHMLCFFLNRSLFCVVIVYVVAVTVLDDRMKENLLSLHCHLFS